MSFPAGKSDRYVGEASVWAQRAQLESLREPLSTRSLSVSRAAEMGGGEGLAKGHPPQQLSLRPRTQDSHPSPPTTVQLPGVPSEQMDLEFSQIFPFLRNEGGKKSVRKCGLSFKNIFVKNMKPSCSGQSLKPEDSPLGCGLVDEASCLSVLASTATLGPQSASPAPSCLPECGGHAAATLSSPGAPNEPCRPSCPSLRSAAFCEAAESKPPARPGEVALLLSRRLSLQGFQAQLAKEIEAEETLGTPQRTGSTECAAAFCTDPFLNH